ncbi:MAG: hypothetical protein H7255_19085 [Ramlibacter sp.]|nr:hypothetical protein [Ramlibacter sp.]
MVTPKIRSVTSSAIFPAVVIAALLAIGVYFDSDSARTDPAAVTQPGVSHIVDAGTKSENGAQAPFSPK